MECICVVQANMDGKSTSLGSLRRLEYKYQLPSGYELYVLTLSINDMEDTRPILYACWNSGAIKSFFCQIESRKREAKISSLYFLNLRVHYFAIDWNNQVCSIIVEAKTFTMSEVLLHSNFQSVHNSNPLPKIMCPNKRKQLIAEKMTSNEKRIKIRPPYISRVCWKSLDFLNVSSCFSLYKQFSVFFSAEAFRKVHYLCELQCIIFGETGSPLFVSVDYITIKGCIIAQLIFEVNASTFQIEMTSLLFSRSSMLLEFTSRFNRVRDVHITQLIKQLLKVSDHEHNNKIDKHLQTKELRNAYRDKHYSNVHQTEMHFPWKQGTLKHTLMTKTQEFFQNHEFDFTDNLDTVRERKNKEWRSYNFENYVEISIFPVFRRNDLEYSFQQILNGTPYLSSEVMRFEHHRLSSFANYTSSDIPSVLLMAKAGWYATGNGMETKTFCCMITHSAWRKEDNPFQVHKDLYYECAFILGSNLDQVSIQRENPDCQRRNSDTNNSNLSEISTRIQNLGIVSCTPNETGTVDEIHRKNQHKIEKLSELSSTLTRNISTSWSIDCPSRSLSANREVDSFSRNLPVSDINRKTEESALNEVRSFENDKSNRKIEFTDSGDGSKHVLHEPVLPPLDFAKPKHIEYSTVGIRMSSFSGFPITSRKTAKEFAVGGFYYRGFGDRTTCFQCGISLQGWSVDDDIFVEHVRYNPLCQYMRRLKGDDFIKLVMTATENPQTPPSLSSLRGDKTSPQNSSAKDVARKLKEMGFSQNAISTALNKVATKNVRFTIQEVLDVIVENTDIEDRNSVNTSITSTEQEENEEHCNSRKHLTNACTSESTSRSLSTNLTSASKSDLELQDQFICKICMDERVGVVFTPCGHIVTCWECSKPLRKCPICRENIRDKIRTVIND